MKLQLALDLFTLTQSFEIIDKLKNHIDIIEVGTPMLLKYGLNAVYEIKSKFPSLCLLADAKIADAGNHEALLCIDAGADIVTILGVVQNSTVSGAVLACKSHNAKLMADTIAIPSNNLTQRSKELLDLGVDYICVHTATDIQADFSPFETLSHLQQTIPKEKTAVAGGININNVDCLKSSLPEIIIIGSAVTNNENPLSALKDLKSKIRGLAHE